MWYLPGVHPDAIGPFRPAAYLTAYAFISLPNGFAATAIQFSLAARSGRPMAAWTSEAFSSSSLASSSPPSCFSVAGWSHCWIRSGSPSSAVEDVAHLWTTVEKKLAVAPVGGRAAHQPPSVDRHRCSDTRTACTGAFALPIASRAFRSTRFAFPPSPQAPDARPGIRVTRKCASFPPSRDFKATARPGFRLQLPRASDARHCMGVVPGNHDELDRTCPASTHPAHDSSRGDRSDGIRWRPSHARDHPGHRRIDRVLVG